ncbi:MAG: AAA family ATPase [Pseudomonadales bacterium]|nr:AAA family ATPase [Pseudomonadales bacterium]
MNHPAEPDIEHSKPLPRPELTIDVAETFGLDRDIARNMHTKAFSSRAEHVPEQDASYVFDPVTTLSILAGFNHNRRVIVQGMHGSGKSSHIEQVAARLNWPCVRVNLDSHISRLDLIGRDAIVLKNGVQTTEFQEGILPWAMQNGTAIIFDEYDAGRPDVMFVIQRLLEDNGKLTLLEQNRVITPHENFRVFATSNTVGLGDATGLYHGSQQINQAQMDRWHITVNLNYLAFEEELNILLTKLPDFQNEPNRALLGSMVAMAELTREGFKHGDISTLMSLRTLISWAENYLIVGDLEMAFRLSFLNKCDEQERFILSEYYQRCFDIDLLD